MNFGEKIKAIRLAEDLKQSEFSELTGIPIKTVQNYEQGLVQKYNASEIQKITMSDRFKKYTLWLMTGDIAPEAGQVSPEVEEARARRA